MIIVHGTRAFRDRIPEPAAGPDDVSTTVLGAWNATVLRWRRPAALFVNERTLPPLVMPLAPAKTVMHRLPDALAELLSAHRAPAPPIEAEHADALDHRVRGRGAWARPRLPGREVLTGLLVPPHMRRRNPSLREMATSPHQWLAEQPAQMGQHPGVRLGASDGTGDSPMHLLQTRESEAGQWS